MNPEMTQEYLAVEKNVYFDDNSIQWASDKVVNDIAVDRKLVRIGVAGTKKPANTIHLFKLDHVSTGMLIDSEIKLKEGEHVFRYATVTTASGGMVPLIKINVYKALAYFPVDMDSSGIVRFETRGIKLDHLRLRLEDINTYKVI